MNPRRRFLAACRKENVDVTPVWFMRQAGRFLPGYREIRSKYSIIELCKTPHACKQVTLMPVNELGVDAAVMFADIMLPLEGIGVRFEIKEDLGPVVNSPITRIEDAEKLAEFDSRRDVPYLIEAIHDVKTSLGSEAALIGFSGAPFTIASYLVEGRSTREFTKTKSLMFNNSATWKALMERLTLTISDYLAAQIEAGVDAVQLFDSWVGALSEKDYEEFVLPYVTRIFRRISSEYPDTPAIHFGTNTIHLLDSMKRAGGDVFSIDWRTGISKARAILGKSFGIQGNLDPSVLLSRDRDDFIKTRVQDVLDDNQGKSGHVFNLGHGILRETPVENARFVVDYVHQNS